ncbi:hypothetical protein LPJ78_004666 [Coemansia sp. RSA 989]|nr:hypothetical protein LPJ78_004666 [Coemansia sp. RSA 989]KAJ1870115.1 hypothetical protein LPJ55_004893 [Coemansia sp. RSA 990]KAJ2668060.1 hypothetical protein IWW42_005492 [Coemansia sp. RSA 1085]
MPVITHRRVNEMRAGRRRLSASVVGGNPGSSSAVSGTSPRSTTAALRHGLLRSPTAVKDHSLRKPGSLERRGSARSAGLPEIDMRIDESLPQPSSSLPASPELAFGLHRHMHAVTSAPKPSRIEMDCSNLCVQADSNSNTKHVQRQSTDVLNMAEDDWSEDTLQFEMDCDNNSNDSRSSSNSNGSSNEDYLLAEPLPTPEQLIMSQTWSTWPTPCHDLYAGSRFSGTQSNGMRSYIVTVSLKYVDMGVPELCGHFTICGLTSDLPKLTTFFDAQIVGMGPHSFITNQWDASIDTDRTHWNFFAAFRPYRNRFDGSEFTYRLKMSDRYVFMRWKERFVVPNYKLSRINGASYEGFYYVCYDREEGSITGYYYHKDSDHYQCLKLTHTRQTSFSHFELA